MAIFPGAVSSFAGFTSGHTTLVDNHAAQHNSEQAEIVAVQTKVGTGSSTSSNNTVLRGNGSGTSTWAQVGLTTDVTGALPIANGGTGQTTLNGLTLTNPNITGTVTGSATYTTPTLSTPVIANFTSATHTHANAAGGGTLSGNTAIQAGTIPFANLLTTIFSGQVLTQANAGTAGGTMSYVNLGGIKILWCISASGLTSGASSLGYTFTLPTSFFSTITLAAACSINQATLGEQYANVLSADTTTVTCRLISPGGAASSGISVYVIGT